MSDIVPENFGSTYLTPIIESYSDLVYRTKSLLGYPVHNVELTDSQWATIIDEAIEIATQFELGKKEEYLVFCSNSYRHGCGVKLDDLLYVGCNDQHCYLTTVVDEVTSTTETCDIIETKTAYLSVTPFIYPTTFDYLNPNSVVFTGISGQYLYLYFDPENPWNANNVCAADCVTINPAHSQWFELSSNTSLSAIVFNFEDDESISYLNSSLSAEIVGYDMSAVPLTAMGQLLSAIPISYYPVSAFYLQNVLYGPPVSACINIGSGSGFIYPNCNTSLINACSALTAQYGISPLWNYVLTSITLSSLTVLTSATNFESISAFFTDYCSDCSCNCALLSSSTSITSAVSSYSFELYKNVLSGSDGVIYDLSARDISDATHIELFNVPTCTTDGSIPLNTNDGIVGTFTLCNSGLSTNGPMTIKKVQFFKDFKPPVEALYDQRCGWENNGFTLSYYNSAHGDCIRTTPEQIMVDVSFCKHVSTTHIGTVSSYLSGNVDTALNRKRKVLGVFAVDPASQSGYFGGGGDLLFNFDYALLASTFGYDLQGTRTSLGRQGYDLLTYHMARSFVEHSKKMLRYVSYTFDPKTQFLKIIPEPSWRAMGTTNSDCCASEKIGTGTQCYIMGVYVEPPIQELLSEYFVREWVLARAQYTLAKIRGKFANIQLYGGVTISGDALATEAKDRMDQLLKELREQSYYVAPASFFIH